MSFGVVKQKRPKFSFREHLSELTIGAMENITHQSTEIQTFPQPGGAFFLLFQERPEIFIGSHE